MGYVPLPLYESVPRSRDQFATNHVGPHHFVRKGAIRHRGECRHCYLPEAHHPTTVWTHARPL